jgi:hypothetical protein
MMSENEAPASWARQPWESAKSFAAFELH